MTKQATMTPAEVRKHERESPRGNKYNAKKTEVDGIMFDSIIEAKRYQMLKTQERFGLIGDLVCQPRFEFSINGIYLGRYTPDFDYWLLSGRDRVKRIVEDVKGMRTRDLGMRLKLMKALYGIDVELWPPRTRKKRKGTASKAVREEVSEG